MASAFLGKCWTWRLRVDPEAELPANGAVFSERFFTDLALLVAAQSDPFPAAEAFFAACPELGDRIAALEAQDTWRVQTEL